MRNSSTRHGPAQHDRRLRRWCMIGVPVLLVACAAAPPQADKTPVVAAAPQAVSAAPIVVPAEPADAVAAPVEPVLPAAPTQVVAATEPVAPAATTPRVKSVAPSSIRRTPTVVAQEEPSGLALSGTLSVQAQDGQAVSTTDITNSVIYFRPHAGPARPRPGHFKLYTHDRQFDPRTLVVPVGSTVDFPNQDHILHNVFSVSPAATFDLGYYGFAGNGQYTFTKPGVALIYCNVHSSMQADVLVVDTPYFTHPGRDGRFSLRGVAPGAGTLWVWNPRAELLRVATAVPASSLQLRLSLTRGLLNPHVNKEQRSY